METLLERVNALRHSIDSDYTLNRDLTVCEALTQLNTSINMFINNHTNYQKLFQTLNQSSLKLYQEQYDPEQIEREKVFIESNMKMIETFVGKLSELDEKEYKIDIDFSILSKQDQLQRVNDEITNLRLKYNQLVIRSINLLQNYLKLNDNMNNFYRDVSIKIGSTTTTTKINS